MNKDIKNIFPNFTTIGIEENNIINNQNEYSTILTKGILDKNLLKKENKDNFILTVLKEFHFLTDISKKYKVCYLKDVDIISIQSSKSIIYFYIMFIENKRITQTGNLKENISLKIGFNNPKILDDNDKKFFKQIIDIIYNYFEDNFKIFQQEEKKDSITKIKEMGGKVYFKNKNINKNENIGIKNISGYKNLKKELTNKIIIPYKNKEEYIKYLKQIIDENYISNMDSYLFEGPPGNGKTHAARSIAEELGIPMIYINIEGITSKWYGEEEKKLSAILEETKKLDKYILFIDEIDTVVSRSGSETSKKSFGIILRFIDGLEKQTSKSIFIATTNHKKVIDKSLINRFKKVIKFQNPNKEDFIDIIPTHIKHLNKKDKEIISKYFYQNFPGKKSVRFILNSLQDFISEFFSSNGKNKLPKKEDYINFIKNINQNEH